MSIHDAAAKGDLATVRRLLDADPALVNQDDQHQWRPIFHAGLWKHDAVVALLIDRGADLAAHEGYVMHYAGEVPDNKRVVELLVKYGALDAHAEPKTELARQFIYAVFLANSDRVRAMLRADPSLASERYARGDQALHHAARNGDTEIVRQLVGSGADVNATTDGGHFPLYCAAGHRHLATTEYLLDQGADLSQTFPDGKTIVSWLGQFADSDPGFQSVLDLIQSRAG